MGWRFPAETGGDIDALRDEAAALARELVAPAASHPAPGWRR